MMTLLSETFRDASAFAKNKTVANTLVKMPPHLLGWVSMTPPPLHTQRLNSSTNLAVYS